MTAHTQHRLDIIIWTVFEAAGTDICLHCIRREVQRQVRATHLNVWPWEVTTRIDDLWREDTGRTPSDHVH